MANDFEEGRTDEAPHEEPFVETDEQPGAADAGETPDDEPDVADVAEEEDVEAAPEPEEQADVEAVPEPEEQAEAEAAPEPEEQAEETQLIDVSEQETTVLPVEEAAEPAETLVEPTISRPPLDLEEQVATEAPQVQETPAPSAGPEPAAAKPAAPSKLASLLASRNGKIGIAAVAAALVLAVLFATHTICFHKWSEATCTEPQICSVCGRTQGEPLGHEWVEATCTEPKTCSRCGMTEGEALGHEVTTWKTTKEATCTAEGEQEGKCTRCGETVHEAIPMKEHEFGEWETTKPATCTEEGEATRKCKNCDETETKTLEMVDHTPGDWEIETPAKPDGSGGVIPGTRVKKCTSCGKVLEEETYELSAEELFDAYAAECQTVSYDEVARNPDDYDGTKVQFRGEVIQVLQDGNAYTLRVNVTDTGYYWDDTIMVYYVASDGDARILEDDIITFYGTMHGMYSYESIFGATITVPLMNAEYIRY